MSHTPTGYWTGCICKECKTLQAASDFRRKVTVDNYLVKVGLLERTPRMKMTDEQIQEFLDGFMKENG